MILIIAAMQEEYNELFKLMENTNTDIIDTITYSTGKILNKDIVLIISGIGKVNAAYATTTILNHFKIDYVLNIGSAGGLTYNQPIALMDIVLGSKVAYHDVDLQGFNYQIGQLPGSDIYYESNITQAMIDALTKIKIPFKVGTIVSGDQFISDEASFSKINSNFEEVIAVEMEGAAIAHICSIKQIPFLIIRSISDVMNNDNNMQFDEYIIGASKQSAQACFEIIKTL